jgi:hypothetical protein
MSAKFQTVPKSEWVFHQDMPDRWRRVCQESTPFADVVGRVIDQTQQVTILREQSKRNVAHWRAVVRFAVDAESCLLFHCGNGGYRAQYYYSAQLGVAANALAVATFADAAEQFLNAEEDADFLRASLRSGMAKTWIYQSTWCRRRAFCDRLLTVPRWMGERDSPDAARRKLSLYATLVPLQETRLELKGAFATRRGQLAEQHKPTRAVQIHELGFT